MAWSTDWWIGYTVPACREENLTVAAWLRDGRGSENLILCLHPLSKKERSSVLLLPRIYVAFDCVLCRDVGLVYVLSSSLGCKVNRQWLKIEVLSSVSRLLDHGWSQS